VRRGGLLLVLAALASGLFLELASILRLNAGHFTYTLDDPYIHLALAERIRTGHYGINPGESSAPSSSIVWPFLLAPFAGASWGEFVPLVLGVLAAIGTAAIYVQFLQRTYSGIAERSRTGVIALLSCLLLLVTNVIGLPFTGMVHSLQILLTALLVLGLVREAETGRVAKWLIPVIVIGPLVRYENLALSLAAAGYFAARRRFRAALVTVAAALVPLVLFSAFLLSRGLGPFPSSVMHKAPALSSGSLVSGVFSALRTSLRDPTGVLLGVAGLWMLGVMLFTSRPRSEKALAGAIAFAIAAHMIGGRYGAYHRWEIYIVVATLLSVLHLEWRSISKALSNAPAFAVSAVAVIGAFVIGGRYIFGLTSVPVAANNIHEQQYQMHRFVTEYERRPVAVNDIGFVSYRNPSYVLDLLGQGSPGIVDERSGGLQTDSLQGAVLRRGIEIAMIYDEWFPVVPPGWRKIGELRLSRARITPAWEAVAFYATSQEAYPAALRRTQAFRDALPPRVSFTWEGH